MVILQHRERLFPGHQHHRDADIQRRVEEFLAGVAEQFEQPRILLSPSAAQADEMHARGLDARDSGLKGGVVGRRAIRVRARRRAGLMQGKPLLGLLDALVMELVVDLPRSERLEQVAPNSLWELAGMNGNVYRR